MDIYVYVEGKTWGPLTREDVEESLADGRLQPEHLAWNESTEEWIPLPDLLAQIPDEAAAPVVQEAALTGSVSGEWRGRGVAGRSAKGIREGQGRIDGMTYRGEVVQRGEGSHEVIPEKSIHHKDKDNRAGVIFIITMVIFVFIGTGLYFAGAFDSIVRKEEKVERVDEERKRVSTEWRRMYLAGLSLELPFTPKAFKLILDDETRSPLYDHEGYETTIGDVRVMLYVFKYRDADFDPGTTREDLARELFERMGGKPEELKITDSDVLISDQPTEGFRGSYRTRYGMYDLVGATTRYKDGLHWIGVSYRPENIEAGRDAERVMSTLRLRSIEMANEAKTRDDAQ